RGRDEAHPLEEVEFGPFREAGRLLRQEDPGDPPKCRGAGGCPCHPDERAPLHAIRTVSRSHVVPPSLVSRSRLTGEGHASRPDSDPSGTESIRWVIRAPHHLTCQPRRTQGSPGAWPGWPGPSRAPVALGPYRADRPAAHRKAGG